MKCLHVIDANCPWVRSLVDALPEDWRIRHYRIYNPRWLPGGWKDLPQLYRSRRLDERREEIYIATPGWLCFNKLSALILGAFLPALRAHEPESHTLLITFPFYSKVAARLRRANPRVKIAYWAHDAFAYYGFPPGYIERHENALVPLCDVRFAMAPQLVRDYSDRYPDHPFNLLHDAVSESFLDPDHFPIPPELDSISRLGRPVVGCVGQINGSYDWNLLEVAATANPHSQFVFIGNLFEEGEITNRIRLFFDRSNVHWLGRVDHARLPAFLQGFDICLNPLAVTEHNHRRDPLRIYDYLTTSAPIYSTDLNGVRMHRNHIDLFDSAPELISRLGEMPNLLDASSLARRRAYISSQTWGHRGREFAERVLEETKA